MFVQPNFTFNGVYSLDMNVSICTMQNESLLNNIGVLYQIDYATLNGLVDYLPYYGENFTEPQYIELNLLIYDHNTMESIDVNEINLEEIYDWLLTDDFAPFISDDDKEIIYYFKVVRISKVLNYDNRGYLQVSFKPFSNYQYRRKIYEASVVSVSLMEVFNYSRKKYMPIIEIINYGDEETINKIGDMEIKGLKNGEKIIIDNLSKIVQDKDGLNKFSCCNRKWIELEPRVSTPITVKGNCGVKIICEFPIVK